MKSLFNYMTEGSIFDLTDELSTDDDTFVEYALIQDFFNKQASYRTIRGDRVDHEDGYIHAESLYLDGAKTESLTSLQDMGIIKGIQCRSTNITNYKVVDPSIVTSNLNTSEVEFRFVKECKDININIESGNHWVNPYNSNFPNSVCFFDSSMKDLKFNNVNINFTNDDNKKIIAVSANTACGGLIKFRGLKSNAKHFLYHTPKTLVLGFPPIFRPTWCDVRYKQDNSKESIYLQNISKVATLINNPKKFDILDNVLNFKDGVKFGDYIKAQGLPDLVNYVIYNNSIALQFVKDHNFVGVEMFGGGDCGRVRWREIKCGDAPTPVTADGWELHWYKFV